MMYDIEIIRSKRRTIAVEVKSDQRVIVRVPLRMKDKETQKFIDEKADWIEKHLLIVRERQSLYLPAFSESELKKLVDRALKDLPERVKKYASLMGVTVGHSTIRHQKTRWGSCSAKGNLSLNCLLILCSEEIRDYVVVHELSHRIEQNHSPRFWAHVEQIIPDYKDRRKWLKENGNTIIGRLR